jgi:hypothetical protein
MDTGWFKIWRKIFNNEFLKRNDKAFKLFVWCISQADKDTHEFTTGRFQIEKATGIKAMSSYKTLKKLEKRKMVTLNSNNKYTIIHICKYKEYQEKVTQESNNNVTTREQQRNTKQELRIENKNNTDNQTTKEAKELVEYYNQLSGKKLTSYLSLLENLKYWRSIYSMLDIKEAFKNFLDDDYWKDKATLEILLRRRNPQGEAVDRIGKFKDKKVIKTKSPYIKNEILGVV